LDKAEASSSNYVSISAIVRRGTRGAIFLAKQQWNSWRNIAIKLMDILQKETILRKNNLRHTKVGNNLSKR
jgi:hypothetical protein